MRFPSLVQFLIGEHFFMLSGPLALAGSVFCWYKLAISRWRGVPLPKARLYLMFGVVTLLLGAVHARGAYGSLANALAWRTVRPEDVSAMRIIRASESRTAAPGKEEMVLTDPKLISEAFAALASAKSWHRNHESLSDGYRIQLKLVGSETYSKYYLSAYRRSSRAGLVAVIIPHIGPDSCGTVHHGGEYSCPQFSQWLAQHADADFEGRR